MPGLSFLKQLRMKRSRSLLTHFGSGVAVQLDRLKLIGSRLKPLCDTCIVVLSGKDFNRFSRCASTARITDGGRTHPSSCW
jgi:hypothetical protein